MLKISAIEYVAVDGALYENKSNSLGALLLDKSNSYSIIRSRSVRDPNSAFFYRILSGVFIKFDVLIKNKVINRIC